MRKPLRVATLTFLTLCVLTSLANASPVLQTSDLASGDTRESAVVADGSGGCVDGVVAEDGKGPAVVRCGFFPSDDAFVDNLIPEGRFGAITPWNEILIVHDVPSVPGSENYAYLKFDLPNLVPRALLMARARPANASLWMYARYVSPFYNASVEVHRASSNDWNESRLTWLNRPAFDTASYAVATAAANGTWVRWDVLGDVVSAIKENTQLSLVVKASETHWKNYVWFDSKEHPQSSNMSTMPELDLDFVEPVLTVEAPYSNLPIAVDGQTFETALNGRFQAYLPWGDYRISVPEVMPKGEGARWIFAGWSDGVPEASRVITMSENTTLGVGYDTQFRVNVSSPYASTNGSGWYLEHAEASVSVDPTVVPAEGLLGLVGVRHIFDHWGDDCIGSQAECRLIIDSPKRATAVWRDDYTITFFAIASIALATTLFTLLRRRRQRQTQTPHEIFGRKRLDCGKLWLAAGSPFSSSVHDHVMIVAKKQAW